MGRVLDRGGLRRDGARLRIVCLERSRGVRIRVPARFFGTLYHNDMLIQDENRFIIIALQNDMFRVYSFDEAGFLQTALQSYRNSLANFGVLLDL